jgi:hypothetical protein
MKVSLAGIYDRGILDKERVHFRADADLDLSFFILLDTQQANLSQVSAGNLSAYWFAARSIPRGQHVVVYTRSGYENVETRNDGSTYHFLFRGLHNPLYALPQARAVLVEVQTWNATTATTTSLPPLPPGPLLSGLGLADLGAASGLGKDGGLGFLRLGDLVKPKS